MVKRVLKYFGYLLFFVVALIAFMPKESFYYLLEKELQKFEVVISGETPHENIFSLELHNLSISAKGIDVAEVESAEITLFGFYNSADFTNIEVSSLIESYAPSHIEQLHVGYTIFNPLVLNAFAQGDFGEARIAFRLLDRAVNAVVKPSEVMKKKYKKTMQMLKKDENGEYSYAKTL